MKPQELEALAKALAPVVQKYVENAVAPIVKEAEALATKAVEEVNEKVDCIEIPVFDIQDIAKQAADLIPKPEKGEPGEPGKPGEKGEKGDPGESGRDALQQIDPDSIARVIERSVEKLTPRVEYDGKRTIRIITPRLNSDPEIVEHTFKTFEWQGSWTDTKEYFEGQVVTCGGSVWHSEKDNKGIKPGTNEEYWKLCVKKGRDAR